MTLEQAVERVEGALNGRPGMTSDDGGFWVALELLLERVKTKPVYTLGEDERLALEGLRHEAHKRSVDAAKDGRLEDGRKYSDQHEALVSALALQEPFTVGEARRLARLVDHYWSYPGDTPRKQEDEMRETLVAKLSAYIEGLK